MVVLHVSSSFSSTMISPIFTVKFGKKKYWKSGGFGCVYGVANIWEFENIGGIMQKVGWVVVLLEEPFEFEFPVRKS